MCPSEFLYFILMSAFTIVLIPLIAILIFYFRKYFTEQCSSTQLSKKDKSEILKFKNELTTQLKELSQKTSAEGLDVPPVVQLQDRWAAIRDAILTHLERDQVKRAKEFEDLEGTIEDFGRESLFSRKTLERVTRNEELYANEMNRRLTEISIQTKGGEDENFGEVVNESSLKAFYDENTDSIFLAIKDCKEQIMSESKSNCENFILEISTFVKQHNKNIEEFLNVIIDENVLPIKKIMAETGDTIEKQFLEISLFVNRKLADVQALEDTMKFFNRKFIHFAEKCETKWNDSCSSFDAARDLVCAAKDDLICSSTKMSGTSGFLTDQTVENEELARRFKDAVQSATAIVEAHKLGNKRMEEVFGAIENMKGTFGMMVEEYGLNLRAMSESLETPSQRFESVVQYVEDLEFLRDLMKDIANKYEGMTTCGHHDNNGHLEDAKDVETSSVISGDGMSSCMVGGSFSEFSFDVNQSKNDENNLPKKVNSRETRRHATLRMMMSVLGDVLSKNAEVDRDGRSLEEKFSSERDVKSKLRQRTFDWPSVRSEISLSDVDCDDLVQNSSSEPENEEECNV